MKYYVLTESEAIGVAEQVASLAAKVGCVGAGHAQHLFNKLPRRTAVVCETCAGKGRLGAPLLTTGEWKYSPCPDCDNGIRYEETK